MEYQIHLDGLHHRIAFVANLCEGRSVLDIGFASHPNTVEQRRAGKLMHDAIVKVCHRVTGIDVQFVAQQFPSRDRSLYLLGDIEEPESLRGVGVHGVVVMGETLEHLGRPQQALENIAAEAMGVHSCLVVTVPNAFRYANGLNGVRGVESVGPHHVCWYSPQTLRRLLERSGYTVMQMVAYGHYPWEERHEILWGRPHYLRSPGIIAVAKLAAA